MVTISNVWYQSFLRRVVLCANKNQYTKSNSPYSIWQKAIPGDIHNNVLIFVQIPQHILLCWLLCLYKSLTQEANQQAEVPKRSKYGKYTNDVMTAIHNQPKDRKIQMFTWPRCCLNIKVSSCPYKNSLYKIRRCILGDIKETEQWPEVGRVHFTIALVFNKHLWEILTQK